MAVSVSMRTVTSHLRWPRGDLGVAPSAA
uniref:SP110 nuclear body protein variant 4 n=1 Tax=Sus scrofa TaxID=9823 RepID=S5A8K4_PIG|nr:SP110 nuclear body protein variant 4 [Sus scrofa]